MMAIIELRNRDGNYMAKTRYGNRYFCVNDPAIEFPIFGNPNYNQKEQIMVFINGVPKKFDTKEVGGIEVNKRNYQLLCEFIKDKRIVTTLHDEELEFFEANNKTVFDIYIKSAKSKPKEVKVIEVKEIEVKEKSKPKKRK